MKVVELKHQSNLMQFSGYNDNYIDIIFNK